MLCKTVFKKETIKFKTAAVLNRILQPTSLSMFLIIFTCQTCGKCSFYELRQSDKRNIYKTFFDHLQEQAFSTLISKHFSLRHHRFGIFNTTISVCLYVGYRQAYTCNAQLNCFYTRRQLLLVPEQKYRLLFKIIALTSYSEMLLHPLEIITS